MTDAVTKEPSAQEMWDEELKARDGSTEKSAETAQVIEPEITLETDDAKKAADTAGDPEDKGEAKTEPVGTETDLATKLMGRLDKIETRQRNVEGHIGGLKTTQAKLLETMEAARTATAEAPTKNQVAQASANSEKWDALRKDFPEWAEATEELLAARIGAHSPGAVDMTAFDKKLEERIGKMLPELRQEIIDSTLEGQFPGWKEEVKTDKFGEWFKAQPQDIQALADSAGIGDASRMLRLYEKAKEADPSVQITDDRKKKLEAAVALPKGKQTPAVKTPDQMTDQELWDFEAKRRAKARATNGF